MLCVLGWMVLLGAPVAAQGPRTADDIARAIVIGQAYISGNVYVAGFVDDESRSWPRRIEGVPLTEGRAERIAADFFRTVVQDSEEHYTFPQREGDATEFADDIFSTMDRMALQDRNLARYRAPTPVDRSVAFLGWDRSLPVVDVSYRGGGQSRPVTDAERAEIAAARRQPPKDIECTTEPQYLDSAKIILTAHLANCSMSIRLSKYMNPGCAGHLSEIYVLDVISPEASRRFEFRHYHGVL
jgi:hypothetical protein